MLNYQIKSMRNAVARMVLRPVPPMTVRINADQAKYLGFDVDSKKLEPAPNALGDDDSTKVVKMTPVVKVKVEDLYEKLKGAKGIDDDNPTGQLYQAGQAGN